MHRRARGEIVGRVLVGIVGDDGEALGAFGGDLVRDLRDREAAFGRLAAGHGDRVIIKDLVGDVDAGRSRGAQRQQTRMGVGAVAEILEDVLLGGEGRLADPVRAFAAHMGDGRGAARGDIERHAVTADAGHGAAALGQFCRGVVRAAGAEERRPLQGDRCVAGCGLVEGDQPRQPLFQHRALMPEPAQPRHQRGGHHGRVQLAFARQAAARRSSSRLPTMVGRLRGVDIIKNAHQLVFDEAALLLDHQHVLQAFGESAWRRSLPAARSARLCRCASPAPRRRGR